MFRILAAVVVATVTAIVAAGAAYTTAVAHEDREEESYNLVVGFLHEPAYEGERNAVSIRVTKPATGMSDGHGTHGAIESETPIAMRIDTNVDELGGVGVQIETEGWRWTPENTNGDYEPGAGHAHIYVDGEKVSRVYGASHYLSGLAPGERDIRVALNSNDHRELTVKGETVEATAVVTIPKTLPRNDIIYITYAQSPMWLDIAAFPDELGGYNLRVIPYGFEFSSTLPETPKSTDDADAVDRGYAKVSIDGKEHTRMYGPWLKLPDLEEGMHNITVSLASSWGVDYEWSGLPVEETVIVHAKAPMPEEMTSTSSALPIEGLRDTLRVEVTHVPTAVSKTMDLHAVFDDPGHYTADLIPTSPGHYRFRFIGAIEGEPVDMTFDSKAGGGDFDDVQTASAIHFPQSVPSARELESAVRGVQDTARPAQETADNASRLATIGILFGAAGTVIGIGSLLITVLHRRSLG